ncbi:uncharacterized protein EV154DRAFT_111968 [Mucor mucedo]|uniref:uncharacterized protein n=1 Tax=Mucor mucedo TaxID=29922 RepID=UPI002221161B|nr:uncharacterized protein EV154DRAFT_111968 [Mucor mucedo]KAI7871418.1 hypothetical protein EV154DRAFT_111968 [Mucor mucedo]
MISGSVILLGVPITGIITSLTDSTLPTIRFLPVHFLWSFSQTVIPPLLVQKRLIFHYAILCSICPLSNFWIYVNSNYAPN